MPPFPLVRVTALDDPGRHAALARHGLLDETADPAFDRLTRMAACLLAAPVAVLAAVERDRVLLKSVQGLARGRPADDLRASAGRFAANVVGRAAPLVVADFCRAGTALHGHEPDVTAVAAVPVSTPDGYLIGALAVTDSAPRAWRDDDVVWLEELAELARTELAARGAGQAEAGFLDVRLFEVALAGRLALSHLQRRPLLLLHVRCVDGRAAGAALQMAAEGGDDLVLSRTDGAAFWALLEAPADDRTPAAVGDRLFGHQPAASPTLRIGAVRCHAGERRDPRVLMAAAAAQSAEDPGEGRH